MAVGVARPHLSSFHPMSIVRPLLYVFSFKWLCEAGPTTGAVEFIERREQGLARNNIDVNAMLVVIPIGVLKGALCCTLLCYPKLLRRKVGYRLLVLSL